jgi:hypothetical protein
MLGALGAVAAVLVAGLQLVAIGSVPSGLRLGVALGGAALALAAVVGLIALVFEVLLPADVTIEGVMQDAAGGPLRGYIANNHSMLNGFNTVEDLIHDYLEARDEAKVAWVDLHTALKASGGDENAATKKAEGAAGAAESWADYLGATVAYVLKRLTVNQLRHRFDWKRQVGAALAAVAVGLGVGLYAWGTNPPKPAATPAISLRGAQLTNADLRGVNLAGADLSGANLNGANLIGAKVDGVVWNDTTCPDGTNSNSEGGTCLGHLGR